MLSELLPDGSSSLFHFLSVHRTWLAPLLILLLSWLAWRLWTFTLRPLLHPDEIEYLPYSLPLIGHAITFYRNPNTIYARGRAFAGDARQPFMIYAAGEKLAVCMDPADQSQIFKDETLFSFDPLIDVIYRGVADVSAEANDEILWRTPDEGFESLHPNPKRRCVVHTGNALLHKQLLGAEQLQDLSEKVLGFIEEMTRWDLFPTSTVKAASADTKVLSLHRWCLDVQVGAQNRAFFGEMLSQIQPQILSLFDQWDINSWKITYRLPPFLTKAATEPRDKIIDAMKRYLVTPREVRNAPVPFVDELEDEEAHAGLSREDSARILMIIIWG